jgi:hypothetical protein
VLVKNVTWHCQFIRVTINQLARISDEHNNSDMVLLRSEQKNYKKKCLHRYLESAKGAERAAVLSGQTDVQQACLTGWRTGQETGQCYNYVPPRQVLVVWIRQDHVQPTCVRHGRGNACMTRTGRVQR